MDADILADLWPSQAATLITALGDAFYTPGEAAGKLAIERLDSFNLIHPGTMLKIDIFPAGPRPFDRQH